MKKFTHMLHLFAVFALLALSNQAIASPIGMASITNCTPGGGITFTATTISWLPAAGSGLGCIATGLPTSIAYSGGTFTSGTGTIEDLPAGSTSTFMTLAGGVLDFSLTAFATPTPSNGVCSTTLALMSGQSCIASVGSPFLFSSSGSGTSVTLEALGVLTDMGNSSTSNYIGLFTTQLSANTAQIAATLGTPGGTIESTYSATLTIGSGSPNPTTPEPASLTLLGTGLAVLAGICRRPFGKL